MEYNSKHSGEEIIKNQEYIVENPEYILGQEVNGVTEYHMAEEYYSDQSVGDSCVTQEHSRFKVIRKMVYLVASAAICVTIGQTIPNDVSEEIQNSMESAEEHHENVIQSEAVNAEIYPAGRVLVSCYEDIGNGNGGRMPYLQDGLWGVLDYEGNVILEPTYQGFWSAPNEDGYTIFYDDNYYYVTDKDGAEILRLDTSIWNNVSIGPDNYILAQYDYSDEEMGRYHYAYYDKDGYLFSEYQGKSDGYFHYANNFNNGRAILAMQSEKYPDYSCIYELDSNAEVLALCETYVPPVEEENVGGYMNSALNGGSGGYHEIYSPLDPVTEDGYYVGIADYMLGKGLINFDTGEAYTFFYLSEEISSLSLYPGLRSYTKDGEFFYHYKTYGCVKTPVTEEQLEEGVTKDFLFDFTKLEGGMLTNYIACYDRIYFNDSKYLLVNDGGDIFYIDFNGNVVSKKLEDATSFTKDGYAMIIEDGNAYVINENFTRLEKIEGVTAVSTLGEIFWYAKGEEEYSYYYNG